MLIQPQPDQEPTQTSTAAMMTQMKCSSPKEIPPVSHSMRYGGEIHPSVPRATLDVRDINQEDLALATELLKPGR